MATTASTDQIMQQIREQRSSESNYAALLQLLDKTLASPATATDASYRDALQEVKEKYAAEYEKAKDTGGTAWPEFEKFVSQFEKALLNSRKEN